MTRSELALLTLLVLAIALTVLTVVSMLAIHHAAHENLGSVVAGFGDSR